MRNKCKKTIALVTIIIILLNICFPHFFMTKTYADTSTVKGNKIANASKNEEGKYKGGTPGDQTHEEIYVRDFYNRPWNVMLRYTNSDKDLEKKVRLAISEYAILAANNDKIGYDQTTRAEFYNQVSKVNYDISSLTTPCAADCSSFVATIVVIVGHKLGVNELTSLSSLPDTASMRGSYTRVGFTAYKDSQYLTSTQNLEPGDILVNEGNHTAIYVGDAHDSSSASWPSLEIDDITVNLDEQNFDFAGSPKNVTYSGKRNLAMWIFKKIYQFIDFIVSLILNGIKYSILGYAYSFESLINGAIKAVEGTKQ